MKVLFDTNVILDLLLAREPFVNAAEYLIAKVEKGELNGALSATTITTIYYLAAKTLGKKQADKGIKNLLSIFEVSPVTRAVIEDALSSGFSDFEDGVLSQAAVHSGCSMIVTRNIKDFKKSSLTTLTPDELVRALVV